MLGPMSTRLAGRKTLGVAGCVLLLARAQPGAVGQAADYHVTPAGQPDAVGSAAAPWDLSSALAGRHKIVPGDTVWVHGGRYKFPARTGGKGFPVRLAGQAGAPVRVRAWPGEQATLDGGLDIQPPSTHLWIWGLEILVSEPRPSGPVPPDPSYGNVNRPWGGVNLSSGQGCKFINLIVHDNCQGASWWAGAEESEMYGCIFHDNGWAGTDRGHGHAIYTQNNQGWKTISDCLFTGGHGYTLHAYGSARADVNNFQVQGNIAYNAHTFLMGGGKPSHGLRLWTNVFFNVPVQLGYNAPTNEDCEIRGNLIVNAGLSVNRFGHVTQADNLVLAPGAPRPATNRVLLRPNRYDPARAHLAIFNWQHKATVEVDTTGFLKTGESFRLLDPRAVFGPPLLTGRLSAPALAVPMSGEFAAFVLMKDSRPDR